MLEEHYGGGMVETGEYHSSVEVTGLTGLQIKGHFLKAPNACSLSNGNTVEPPNKGHVGTSHFVLYREVVLSLEVENVLVLWESKHLGP